MSISFNGSSKIIKLDTGVTSVNVQDIYSRWKEWASTSDNLKFPYAFRYVGGDPTINGQRLGVTYFLINGWKIEPFSGDQILVINGNIFCEDGTNPFVKPSDGDYNILISNQFSNLSTIIETNSSGGSSSTDVTQIANAVWGMNINSTQFTDSGTIGNFISSKILTVKKFLGLS